MQVTDQFADMVYDVADVIRFRDEGYFARQAAFVNLQKAAGQHDRHIQPRLMHHFDVLQPVHRTRHVCVGDDRHDFWMCFLPFQCRFGGSGFVDLKSGVFQIRDRGTWIRSSSSTTKTWWRDIAFEQKPIVGKHTKFNKKRPNDTQSS